MTQKKVKLNNELEGLTQANKHAIVQKNISALMNMLAVE